MHKTDEQLEQLAKDIVDNKVFTSWHLKQHVDLELVFPVLAMMEKEQIQKLIEQEANFFYEYYEKAGSRGLNGYPMFLSMQWLSLAEEKLLRPKVELKEKLVKEALDAK